MDQPTSEDREWEEEEDWEIGGQVRLQRADYLHAWGHVPQHRTIRLYFLFLPFGFLLCIVGSPLPWRQWLPYLPWAATLAPLRMLAAWAHRNHWTTVSFDRVGSQRISYCFDAEGLSTSSSFGQHRYVWTGLRSVETSQALLIFFTDMQFLLVPKRAFTAAELP